MVELEVSRDRTADGSAGDVDYGSVGTAYREYRAADPRIAAFLHAALGEARSVLNIGAGTGSYEPTDRLVTPVEPSATMRAKRSGALPTAIDAYAEHLPFGDGFFDAAMGTFTVHQWADLASGLAEVRRVTRGPVALLTCDPARLRTYWLHEYAPEVIETEASRFPPVAALAEGLGGAITVNRVPIPLDCKDGFNDAYYGRPEMFLKPAARMACSAWSFVAPAAVSRFEAHLAKDLADGTWDKKHGHLRNQAYLVTATKLQARGQIEAAWGRVAMALSGAGPYLLGSQVSVADFLLTMLMLWSRKMPKPTDTWPALHEYAARMKARPSFKQVHAREGLLDAT